MGNNVLMDTLRSDPKYGNLFESNAIFTAYKTGFPTLDYKLGFNVNVFDKDGNVDYTYPSLGISAGTIVGVIGKTHVGKTTLAIQLASNIVRPFPNGTVLHFDLEGGTNMTRIGIISKFTSTEMSEGKYILRQSNASIEDIKMTISRIYLEKKAHPEIYQYDTGKVNELGEPIVAYEPTCLIIDSIPSLSTYINENTKDGIKKLGEVDSQTGQLRLTQEVGRFLKESMQMMRSANIIMFVVNHIKEKLTLGVPQAPELMYLKQNETMPCGKALQYYTDTLIRLTAIGSEKYLEEDYGFDGFGVKAQFVKNRSNVNGSEAPLVFDKFRGYDSLWSSLSFAKENELLGGNKNGRYFISNKELKFTNLTAHQDFANNRELYKIMYDNIKPILSKSLKSVSSEEMQIIEEEMDY